MGDSHMISRRCITYGIGWLTLSPNIRRLPVQSGRAMLHDGSECILVDREMTEGISDSYYVNSAEGYGFSIRWAMPVQDQCMLISKVTKTPTKMSTRWRDSSAVECWALQPWELGFEPWWPIVKWGPHINPEVEHWYWPAHGASR